jgi:hypothetical protein
MLEGTSRGSKDGYFKLYTHQRAKLIQLEEENRHLRSALGDMRSILVARQSQTEDWHRRSSRSSMLPSSGSFKHDAMDV